MSYPKGPPTPPQQPSAAGGQAQDLAEGIKAEAHAITNGINALSELHKTSAIEMAKTMQAFDSLQQATLQGALITQGQMPTTLDENGNVQMANITSSGPIKPAGAPTPTKNEPLLWSQAAGVAVNAAIQIYVMASGTPMDPQLAVAIGVVVQSSAALIARQFVTPVK